MVCQIQALTRYPIKGLSGQAMQHVSLISGQGFPNDRRFGFARPNSGFNPSEPKPLPKTKFYMLARDASLALLDTRYDDESNTLTFTSGDKQVEFNIETSTGKSAASDFLKNYLQLPSDETPELFEASPHRFTDVSVDSEQMMNAVSIINADSVAAFSKAIGQTVDPNRFRGNILISGLDPFAELDLVDQKIRIGDAELKIVKRTRRCPATEVNLDTGERDLKTPRLLREQYNHMDMGVYAEVIRSGAISVSDELHIDDTNSL